jgi:hypothetical protein
MYIKSNTGENFLYMQEKEVPIADVNKFIYVRVSDVFVIYDPKVHYNQQLYLQCGLTYHILYGFISPNGCRISNGDSFMHHLNSSKVYLYNLRGTKSNFYGKFIEVTDYYEPKSSLANGEFR